MELKMRYAFVVIFFVSCISVENTQNGNENAIIIPVDLDSQRPIVELKIGGKGPYKFIFDTGASGTVIDDILAEVLGFEVIGEDTLQTPGSENKLMSKRMKVPKVTFDSTDISKDVFMSTMAIREMLAVDGVLSANFFADYLLTMDYANSRLILNSGELTVQDEKVIPFLESSRIINLDVVIAGKKVEAHLDSGNPGGIDIPYSLKNNLNFKEELQEAGMINTPVASFKKWKTILDGDIKIGDVIYKNPEINLVENFQYVNLGYQIFKDLRITIDKKNRLIKFEKASAANESIKEDKYQTEENEYTGWYGDHKRKIFIEKGEMYLRRGNAPKLKMVKIKEDEYKMEFSLPVMNELPLVKFQKDESNRVTGLNFVFKDGREEFVVKDDLL
jgi:hypothetical protein